MELSEEYSPIDEYSLTESYGELIADFNLSV